MDIYDVDDAIRRNDVKLVHVMIDQEPSVVYLQGRQKNTPLHAACYRVHTDVVQLLIDAGADVNAQTNNNATQCLIF